MDYYSEVVIQIETKNLNGLKKVIKDFKQLEINEFTNSDNSRTYKYVMKNFNLPEEEIYTLVLHYNALKWYETIPAVKEVEKWFKKYSDIAEVGENTYGILSTQFQRIGENDDDNEYQFSGDPYNYICLVREIQIDAEKYANEILVEEER